MTPISNSTKGIVVEGSNFKVHSRNGVIESLSGNFRDIFIDLNVSPWISANSAFSYAVSLVAASEYEWDRLGSSKPAGELVIVADPGGVNSPRLAYKF